MSVTSPSWGVQPMEIDFLILADAAQVADGKLYLLGGGWDRLVANALPVTQPAGIAVGILVPWSETNSGRTLTLTVEDEDGGPVLPPIAVRVEVGRPAGLAAGAEQRVLLAFNAQIVLPRLGEYAVTATIDDTVRRRQRFGVISGPSFRTMNDER